MSETIKYTELQDIFVNLTALLRDIDLKNENESDLVRLAYQLNSAPFQEIRQGVSYVWINYADNDTNKQINEEIREVLEDEITIKRSQLRQIDVHWIFYGDESVQDISYEFRNMLYSYKAKSFLDKYDIKLIVDVPEAVLLYEQLNNQWWARVELIVSYYLESALIEEIPLIDVVNIDLITEKESLNREVIVKEK
ncbi:hypothetical protein [Anaerofustis sp.]|uniref:phage neck terminator protein n=1 Tax=Anaerofustis sp. TaxID=1872517 RepID=UPI0025BE0C3F|nr:hypothetical protein [Anaerofustis sp.]